MNESLNGNQSVTRRKFLGTLGALSIPCLLSGQETPPAQVNLLAMGDWGAPLHTPDDPQDAPTLRKFQNKVAAAMEKYAKSLKEKSTSLDAVLPLGDNYYEGLASDHDQRFQSRFEDLYPAATFDCPFFFALGNHEYEDGDKKGHLHQLGYAARPEGTRWRFPAIGNATWYRVDFGKPKTLLTMLVLNSNFDHIGLDGKHDKRRWTEQAEWLKQELKSPQNGPWVVCVAHHPMWTKGFHWKGAEGRPGGKDIDLYNEIRKLWLPHLGGVVYYLSGHDHNLQHISHPDHKGTDFLLSGAGGGGFPQDPHTFKPGEPKPIYEDTFMKSLGFVHLQFSSEAAMAHFITVDKNTGESKIVHSVPRPKVAG